MLCNSKAVRIGFFETSAEVGEKPIKVRPIFLGQGELAVLASDDMLLYRSVWFLTRKTSRNTYVVKIFILLPAVFTVARFLPNSGFLLKRGLLDRSAGLSDAFS